VNRASADRRVLPPETTHAVDTGLVETLPWLAALRDDERARAASRFRVLPLAAGERLALADQGVPMLGVVLAGHVRVRHAAAGGGDAATLLWPGDRWDEVALFTEVVAAAVVEADEVAVVALLDRPAFLALVGDFPIVWVAVAERLSRELKATSDLLREIRDLESTETPAALARFLAARRRRVGRRGGVTRAAARQVLARLVSAHVREPTFWVLAGFAAAILASRAVVTAILGLDLEHRLFNLRDSGGPNPVHVHHFNYGFAIVIAAGLCAFFPTGRRHLRAVAAAFGVGLGLVFDEFALIWNLHPDYYQPLNYWAQALLGVLLAQLVYFRRLYGDLATYVLARAGRRA